MAEIDWDDLLDEVYDELGIEEAIAEFEKSDEYLDIWVRAKTQEERIAAYAKYHPEDIASEIIICDDDFEDD